ncbi:MAG: tetratricopeptide repeat protein [Actinomycetota bacterium]|nr:tetratricopeptide repeat protein [Actinomycetota bacterium]
MTDVTDATFEAEVLVRSEQVPVVVDLWAPWCGPCRVLGPVIERVVAATGGAVGLAKVNVDESPGVSSSFRVQSIPAVFAVRDRQVVDSFVGALPEAAVAEFVAKLSPTASEADRLADLGDEASLRKALELDPGHTGAVVALAEILVGKGESDEALSLLARVAESPETKRVAAIARLSEGGRVLTDPSAIEARLDSLLDRVKADDSAKQEYLDLLEAMGPSDPRTPTYRRKLTTRLF